MLLNKASHCFLLKRSCCSTVVFQWCISIKNNAKHHPYFIKKMIMSSSVLLVLHPDGNIGRSIYSQIFMPIFLQLIWRAHDLPYHNMRRMCIGIMIRRDVCKTRALWWPSFYEEAFLGDPHSSIHIQLNDISSNLLLFFTQVISKWGQSKLWIGCSTFMLMPCDWNHSCISAQHQRLSLCFAECFDNINPKFEYFFFGGSQICWILITGLSSASVTIGAAPISAQII